MEYLFTKAKKNQVLLIFHFVFLTVIFLNFPFNSSFIGWDSINPELNFGINFQRALTATWQENYGAGSITGHGFAGTLPHTVITYLLSFILPQIAIRPAFIFLMLYMGGLGMLILMNTILKVICKKETFENLKHLIPSIALLSSLYYMFNLGTVQIFYAPLETFIAHFAALPWLFYIILKLLNHITPQRILVFIIISFLSTLQGFIPSLFLTYLIAMGILLVTFLISKNFSKTAIKKTILVISLTILANSFWVIPLITYQLTQNDSFLTSYNNLTSTQHFIDVNNKYGNATNVMLLKGYLFDAYQLDDYILRPWIDHLNLLFPKLIGYLFFATILTGVLFSIFRIRNWILNAFALIFLFFLASIATNTQPFASLIGLLQWISPTYEQAFRTAFTKFSIGAAFTFSIFLGLGVFGILQEMKKRGCKKTLSIFIASLFVALLLYSLPIFKGHLLYDKLKINIPPAYSSVMNYFTTQGDGRIADFPQECADGWYAYKWGYFGSGFYWYGIKQPFMSRSFDVWSKNNENYYWEVTNALHRDDFDSVIKVLEKYHVKWILYDPNTYFCNSQRSILTHQAFMEYLHKSPGYKLIKTFESTGVTPILLFESTDKTRSSYTTQATGLQNIGPNPTRHENDQAYKFDGTYISTTDTPLTAYYPFASLNTKRGDTPDGLITTINDSNVTLTTTIPEGLSGYKLLIKKYSDLEQIIPASIIVKRNSQPTSLELSLSLTSPEVLLDGQKIWGKNLILQLGKLTETDIIVKINGQEVPSIQESIFIGALFTHLGNTIEVFDKKNNLLLTWDSSSDPVYLNFTSTQESIDIPRYSLGELSVRTARITNQESYDATIKNQLTSLQPIPCNEITPSKRNRFETKATQEGYLRLSSKDSSQCLNLYLPKLFTNNGYLVKISSRNVSGNKLKLNIYQTARIVYGPHPINSSSKFTDTNFILPPTLQNGIGYDAQLINVSENQKESINDIAEVSFTYLPYQFLKEIRLARPQNLIPTVTSVNPLTSEHPYETLYKIKRSELSPRSLLILNQSFHSGWHAYEITPQANNFLKSLHEMLPFIFGKELKNHTVVNGWSNGWAVNSTVNENSTIIIIFLPQVLQNTGYILLLIGFLASILIHIKSNTLDRT